MGLGGVALHRVTRRRVGRSDLAGFDARRMHRPTRRRIPIDWSDGADGFVAWGQELIERTIEELNGTYFEIADPLRRCQAMAAPFGGPDVSYYTPPSEDFGRPGQIWLPVAGKETLPAVGRGHDDVPRKRSGPSPAAGPDDVPSGFADPVPTPRRRHSRARRGLGVVRRTIDARARIPRRSGAASWAG